MTADSVSISPSVAIALSSIGIGDFNSVELPERMAFVFLVLRELEDREEWFPRGKWATLQHIESQLLAAARERAAALGS